MAVLIVPAAPARADHPLEGTLTGVHADDFADRTSSTSWRLQREGESLPLLPTSLPALAPEDARVRVLAQGDGSGLVGPVRAASPRAAPLLGGRRLAVIMVNFQGDTRTPWSADEVRQRTFTGPASTSAYFREESYDQLWLTGKTGNADGDVYGWYALDAPTAGCPYQDWGAAARAAAAADGFNAADYQHVMYVFPAQPSCGWAGLAYMPGSSSWINGDLTVRVTAHELGHNLGLNHAGSYACGPAVISGTCTLSEYGDPFDVMGLVSRHSHGWHLQRLGVLQDSNVQTVTASGTYTVRAALHQTTEPTILRIPRRRAADGAVLDWYYLEVRERGLVFDDFAVGDFVLGGVSIRLVDDPARSTVSRLLDANPTSGGTANAPLAVGRTFNDGAISVTTLAAGTGHATVHVSLAAAPADTTPPSAPAGLRHTLGAGGVRLEWEPSVDDSGVSRYAISRDGLEIGTSGAVAFDDSSAPSGPHVYTVAAEDVAGNRSGASAPYTLTVPGPIGGDGVTNGADHSSAGVRVDAAAPRVGLGRRRVRRGLLLLRASARDDRGVARMELWIDGRRRWMGRGPRLSFRWHTRRARPGRHRVVARAVDTSGNASSAGLRLRTRR
jgi:Gametolysin peptidase M11